MPQSATHTSPFKQNNPNPSQQSLSLEHGPPSGEQHTADAHCCEQHCQALVQETPIPEHGTGVGVGVGVAVGTGVMQSDTWIREFWQVLAPPESVAQNVAV